MACAQSGDAHPPERDETAPLSMILGAKLAVDRPNGVREGFTLGLPMTYVGMQGEIGRFIRSTPSKIDPWGGYGG